MNCNLLKLKYDCVVEVSEIFSLLPLRNGSVTTG